MRALRLSGRLVKIHDLSAKRDLAHRDTPDIQEIAEPPTEVPAGPGMLVGTVRIARRIGQTGDRIFDATQADRCPPPGWYEIIRPAWTLAHQVLCGAVPEVAAAWLHSALLAPRSAAEMAGSLRLLWARL